MRKRLLLVCFPDNIHIYNIVRNVLLYSSMEITMYSMDGPRSCIRKEYLDFYENNGIKVIDGVELKEVGAASYVSYAYKSIKKLGKFDVLHLHFVSHYLAPVLFLLRRNFSRVLLSFWGSDVRRMNSFKRFLITPLVRYSDNIMFVNEDMKAAFLSSFKHLQYKEPAIRVMGMGFMFTDGIDSLRGSSALQIKKMKEAFGLSSSKKLIVLGYHGRHAMQQVRSLKSIVSLKGFPLNEVQFIVPAVGMGAEDLHELNEIAKNDLDVKIFDKFIPNNHIAEFRYIADVFVNAQTSDASSGSMIEYLYAGVLVLNGEWLVYSSLDKRGIYHRVFKDFESLPIVLKEIIENFEQEKEKASKNYLIYGNTLSWEFKRPLWLGVY